MTEEYRISRAQPPLLTSLTLTSHIFPIISGQKQCVLIKSERLFNRLFIHPVQQPPGAETSYFLVLLNDHIWFYLISQTPLVIPWKLSNSENVGLILTKFVLRNLWKIFQIIKSILSSQNELIQHFCWKLLFCLLSRGLGVAPLFVRNLYKTGVQSMYRASWQNANICWCLPFSADNNSSVLWCGERGKPSPNSVKLNPIMSREEAHIGKLNLHFWKNNFRLMRLKTHYHPARAT